MSFRLTPRARHNRRRHKKLSVLARSRGSDMNLELLEERACPAVFDVNSLGDTLTPPAGQLTLREAIQEANNTPGNNTIDITVAGRYNLSLVGAAGETDNQAGELALLGTGNLNIVNTSGGTVIIDGGGLNRVFDINPGGENTTPFTVSFQGLTITGGNASPGDGSLGSGGGIRAQGAASVVLDHVLLTGNTATADGGGIALESPNNDSIGTLTVSNSVISNNHAGDAGGGIETDGTGLITINPGTVITENSCVNQGAGIWLDAGGASLNVTGAVISDNRAITMLAGGIGNAGAGNVTINNSLIEDNFSGGTGGGFGDAANTGNLTVNNSLFLNNTAAADGGAIQEGGPNVTISFSTFDGNLSQGNGGGLFVNGANATVSIDHSVFRGNIAVNGGGIEDQAGALTVTASTFEGNHTLAQNGGNGNQAGNGGFGGGIDVEQGANTVNLANDLFLRNVAVNGGTGDGGANGGAIFQNAGSLTVSNSQFTLNAASLDGGAIAYNLSTPLVVSGSTFNGNRAFDGGALFLADKVAAMLTNDTLVNNTAGDAGGAIGASDVRLTLVNDTINNNSATTNGGGISLTTPAGPTQIQNTIVALNTAGGNGPDIFLPSGVTLTDNGGNLIGNLNGTAGFGANTLTGNPKLGPLENNGGQWAGAPSDRLIVETEALLPGSPALDTGVLAGAPTTDERGFPRPGGGNPNPSIGAYEPQFAANATPNQVVVESIYETLLNRLADPSSAFWVNALKHGASTGQIVQAIESSNEYRGDEVQNLFLRYLHRQADPGGLQAFVNFLGHGGSLEQLSALLVGSEEYWDLHGANNESFLDSLFEDALNRAPDAGGMTSFNQALNSGQSPAAVAAMVFSSPEFLADLVNADFQEYLARPADPAAVNFFVHELQSGVSDQTLTAQILGSTEALDNRS